MKRRDFLATLGATMLTPSRALAASAGRHPPSMDKLLAGNFNWRVSPPLVSPANRIEDPCHAIKDPSIVNDRGRWHLFCSIRSQKRSAQIEYLSFDAFENANKANRYVLKLTEVNFGAPQVFYFSPHRLWYLIYQVIDPARKPVLQPAYSTTRDISDPTSWTKPLLLFSEHPEYIKMWIDFWVICDANRAHLFFTSLDGKMWRAETRMADFPKDWSKPRIVLQGDIFEASHTYRLKGLETYLTIVEARTWSSHEFRGWRYYKAYIADRLDGRWMPLATTSQRPFAGLANVQDIGPHWTDSFSHRKLIRNGVDETLQVDPGRLEFLFQGVSDADRAGKKYAQIPWRLGLLRPADWTFTKPS